MFVTKLSSTGSALVYSTFLGGTGSDAATSIALDQTGRAILGGYTSSANFPVVGAPQSAFEGAFDAFASVLDSGGANLVFSSYFGGSSDDRAYAVAALAGNNLLLAGVTASTNFPTASATQNALAGGDDGFVLETNYVVSVTANSVTPSSGTGLSENFNFVLADPNGAADISYVIITFGPSSSELAGVCLLYYNPPPANVLYLLNDAGTDWVGAQSLGTPGALQNSQCSLNTGASSSFGSGNNLTVDLALTFKSAFAGNRTIYAVTNGKSGWTSNWLTLGTWNVSGTTASQPPAPVSVLPSSGNGLTGSFSFLFADPNGYADISSVSMNFGAGNSTSGACYLSYSPPPANTLSLLNDAGTAAVGSQSLGTPGTLQNSQCSINTGASSSSGSGNNLTVNLALTFKGAFAGTKNIYAFATGQSGSASGWQTMGTWTVPATVNQPPSPVSVTPNSGNGSSGTFAFLFTDPNGYADISSVAMNFGASNSTAGVCYLSYNPPPANTLSLLNDAGTAAAGSQSLGTAGTLQNSQCSINTGASSSSASSNNLTVSLALTFKSGFAGNQSLFASATGQSGSASGWQTVGTWTVPPIASQPPSGLFR